MLNEKRRRRWMDHLLNPIELEAVEIIKILLMEEALIVADL